MKENERAGVNGATGSPERRSKSIICHHCHTAITNCNRLKFHRRSKCFNLRIMETLSRRTNIYFPFFLRLSFVRRMNSKKYTYTHKCSGTTKKWKRNTTSDEVTWFWCGDVTQHWKIYYSTYFLVMLTPSTFVPGNMFSVYIFIYIVSFHLPMWPLSRKLYVFWIIRKNIFPSITNSPAHTHQHTDLLSPVYKRRGDIFDKALTINCFVDTLISVRIDGRPFVCPPTIALSFSFFHSTQHKTQWNKHILTVMHL